MKIFSNFSLFSNFLNFSNFFEFCFTGHRQAIRDVNFNNCGDHFLSASYDRYVKLWNTETGQCVQSFTNNKVAYCCKFNPDEDKQHLFVAGTADKKILCWDTRSGEIVQVRCAKNIKDFPPIFELDIYLPKFKFGAFFIFGADESAVE